MTKGVDSGDRFISGNVRDRSSQKPLKPHSESLEPAGDASIPVEGLHVEKEPRSTTTELMANPVQSTGAGSASPDTKRNRKPRKLLNVKSLGEINPVLDISDAYVNACMTHMSAVREHDIDVINIPKSFAESRRCEEREK